MFAQIRSLSLAAVLAAVSLAVSEAPAAASPQCGNHNEIAKVLTTKYNETRRALGVVSETAVMEVFMSPEGTWTVLVTDTSGTACITASGEGWQNVNPEVAGLDS
jgi:hypothetical protein